MIRCHKCGFSNQLNAKDCIKCRTVLVDDGSVAPEAREPDPRSKKTIIIGGSDETPWEQLNPVPPQQRIQRNLANHAAANTPANTPNTQRPANAQTVRRVVPDPNFCSLLAMSLDGQQELRKIDLRSNAVSLNRALLDPANNSISRNGHATIYQKDGNWYLENNTAMQTTFIQVKQPVKLTDGDVMLLGDSLFKFVAGRAERIEDNSDL
jgi:hypothetical protein